MLSNLECLLREAHASGRLALLPALNLAPHHNFGIDRDWRWDAYVDFEASRLLDSAGEEHPTRRPQARRRWMSSSSAKSSA